MEQVLSSCCGFLHDMSPVSEKQTIDRFLTNMKGRPDCESGGIKRRAFLVTSMELPNSVSLFNGRFVQTLTPWKVGVKLPTDAHHVKAYTSFSSELVMNKTVLSIYGFDGDLDIRQEEFDKLDKNPLNKELPRLCILSNAQHELGEPFLLKNGYKVVLRGRNTYWYNNHLTIFTRVPDAA